MSEYTVEWLVSFLLNHLVLRYRSRGGWGPFPIAISLFCGLFVMAPSRFASQANPTEQTNRSRTKQSSRYAAAAVTLAQR